jgi:hypothetical protein
VLRRYGCELIGASPEAIEKAEDRQKFKVAMQGIGLGSARSGIAHNLRRSTGSSDNDRLSGDYQTDLLPLAAPAGRHRLQPGRISSKSVKRGLDLLAHS